MKNGDLPTWRNQWTARIGRTMKDYRRRRGLSAQRLSERCKDLGVDIPRNTIANIESGRRDAVSVQDLLAIAAALDVAPISLMFPIGIERDVELLPDVVRDTFAAVRWFSGEGVRDPGTEVVGRPSEDIANFYRTHETLLGALDSAISLAAYGMPLEAIRSGQSDADRRRNMEIGARQAEQLEIHLRDLRDTIRERGFKAPPLPNLYRHVDTTRDWGNDGEE